jgi:hypothetical protein
MRHNRTLPMIRSLPLAHAATSLRCGAVMRHNRTLPMIRSLPLTHCERYYLPE